MVHLSEALLKTEVAEKAKARKVAENGRLRAFLALHDYYPKKLPFFSTMGRANAGFPCRGCGCACNVQASNGVLSFHLAAPHVFWLPDTKHWRVDVRKPNRAHATLLVPDGERDEDLVFLLGRLES